MGKIAPRNLVAPNMISNKNPMLVQTSIPTVVLPRVLVVAAVIGSSTSSTCNGTTTYYVGSYFYKKYYGSITVLLPL